MSLLLEPTEKSFTRRTKMIQEITEEMGEKIIELRNSKKSLRQIEKLTNVQRFKISDFLKTKGISTDKYKIKFDFDFFEKIDTEEKAYCLGLILTDGFVQFGRTGLNMTDKDVIEKVKQAVKYEGEIRVLPPSVDKPHHKTKYEINLFSVKMFNDLAKYGVVPNKSLILEFPPVELIPKNLIHHMIRGIWDGDGSMTFYKNIQCQLVFTGTKNMAEGVERSCKIFGQYHQLQSNKNTYHWKIRKQEYIINFLKWIYKDATIYMDRKKITANKCIAFIENKMTI